MITGAHSILYSTNPDADRDFLRDVVGLPHVDVGHGWLIFGLPPAEIAVHPSEKNGTHELYFMCDDIEAFVAAMTTRGVTCGPVQNQGWGMLTQLTLPGGSPIGVYQPRHARPEPMRVDGTRKPAAKRAAKKPARKAAAKAPARRTKKKRAR